MTGTTRVASAAILVMAALAACAKKQPPPPPPAPVQAPNQDSINAEQARRDSIARAEQARRDSIARAEAEAARLREAREAAIRTISQVIYFDFDSDAITDEARAILDAKIPVLNANPDVRIRIAGNADERGSDEYNMALGQRRAAAAKRYLTQHGIADDRIEIISYGEERPAVQGHDESAWSKNRRDEFEITAGADQIKGVQ
jgi:peptidoglycan-associated lipoprotein